MNQNKSNAKQTRHIWRRARFFHWLGRLCMLLVFVLIALLLVMHRVFLGPSHDARNSLTMTLLETSALKFVPYLYMSDETIEQIKAETAYREPEGETDAALIDIPADIDEEERKSIELVKLKGSTYKGYLLIVHDPARIRVGVVNENFSSAGLPLDKLIEKYGAIGGINANGFEDKGGMGDGGTPLGLVVADGRILHHAEPRYASAGFDQNNVLHVGKFTDDDVVRLGLRDAVSYGPALIVNGVPAESTSTATGFNPRTAIGQRADGAVLLLVLDGRQTDSLGATFQDLIDTMLQYGAVNACNLDGGTSTAMYYNGERVNGIAAITGTRSLPCAILIMGE